MLHTYNNLIESGVPECSLLEAGDVADCGAVFEAHEVVKWGAKPEAECPSCRPNTEKGAVA